MKKLFVLIALVTACEVASAQFRRPTKTSNQEVELNYVKPDEYEIAQINVTGVNVLDKNALVSLTGLKVGDKIKVPGDAISGAIKKLWKHGLVGDVSIYIEKIEAGKAYIKIELTERPRLTGFTFEGVNKSKESELREDLNLIRGRVLSDAVIKNAELTVKNHYVTKGYLNTEVKIVQEKDTLNRDGVKLRVVVDRNAKVRVHKIYFSGNENISDNKLKGKMKSTNEKPRVSLFRSTVGALLGRKNKQQRIYADSTDNTSDQAIQRYVNDNVKLNFLKSTKFVSNDFEEDKKSIIDFYNSKGYRDASIEADTIYAVSKNEVNVELKVREGRKYYFRDIEWTGNYVYSDEVLGKVLAVKKGDVYDMELINKKLNFNPSGPDITGLYMDNGYLFFNVTPVEVGIEGDSIDIEMRVYEGVQATINKIIITGNDRTNDHVILRELLTVPGQKFSRSDIIATQQRLSQLGYFDPEQIAPTPLPNQADGTVDIEWKLVERSSDQVELSGGWGGAFGFVGTVGLVFNNFSVRNIPHFSKWRPLPVGDGQRVSIRAQASGRQFQSYSMSFTEPWLGGKKPNSLTVSFNHSVQRTLALDARNSRDFDGSLKLTGVTVGLGRRLQWPDRYFTLQNSLSYFIYSLDNFRGTSTTRSLGFNNGTARSFTFNTTLARNSIDNPMYPTTGSQVSLSVELTPPYSLWRDIDYETASAAERNRWIEYHKWMFDASHYTKLAGKLVLEARAHFGFIGSYTQRAGVGPFERFELGGDGLAGQNFILGTEVIGLRGYENRSIVPPFSNAERIGNNFVEGGVVFNKFVGELRYAITTGQAATIYGLVFAEAGNNWYNFEEFNPFNLFKSAGFGARIFMPAFGLIGVNWGYGFDTLPGASAPSGGQFQFTIGQQIR